MAKCAGGHNCQPTTGDDAPFDPKQLFTFIELEYQHIVIAALLNPKVFGKLSKNITISRNYKVTNKRLSCPRELGTCHYEVSQSIMVASARGIVV